ncbi:hypothetical protein [Kribbella sp. NPDC004536]|uniref:hypothetical protein n=1 Tax=Kribbella sp. NPDC004536 TaxID=3364106 RepID=UPI0036A21C42
MKQALAIATGVDKRRFVSTTATHHLRRLGFLTSEDGGRRSSTYEGTAARKQVLDPATLPRLDQVNLPVSFVWLDAGQITLDRRGLPSFPRLPSMPGLYRFDFGSVDGTRVRVYVGESEDLARRARNYRNANSARSTQQTSRRIHTELVSHLSNGGRVHFAISTDVTLGVGGAADLRWKSARRLAENAAVSLPQLDTSLGVLNIDTDLESSLKDKDE